MQESNLEVPTELRELVVKSVDQAEKAFGFFFDAANRSLVTTPPAAADLGSEAAAAPPRKLSRRSDQCCIRRTRLAQHVARLEIPRIFF
jgi:hypothetical protein